MERYMEYRKINDLPDVAEQTLNILYKKFCLQMNEEAKTSGSLLTINAAMYALTMALASSYKVEDPPADRDQFIEAAVAIFLRNLIQSMEEVHE